MVVYNYPGLLLHTELLCHSTDVWSLSCCVVDSNSYIPAQLVERSPRLQSAVGSRAGFVLKNIPFCYVRVVIPLALYMQVYMGWKLAFPNMRVL